MKSADPNAVIRVLLSGKEGTIGLMPPVGATYDDEQIAAVLTFVRRSWGNAALQWTRSVSSRYAA